jgi:hypothetical protein
MPVRLIWFFGLGAASGLLSGAIIVFCHMGDFAAPEVAGYCFGLRESGGCKGIDTTFYLFPGTIFGVLFAAMRCRRGWIGFGRFIGFVCASGFANAVAVFVCVWLTDRLGDALNIDFLDLPMAIAGAIAGAAGGALLGGAAGIVFPELRLRRSVIAASVLGLLVPLVVTWEIAGVFLFFAIWQAGYAAALASSLPAEA